MRVLGFCVLAMWPLASVAAAQSVPANAAGSSVTAGGCVTSGATAGSRDDNAPTIVLVMESPGGVQAAAGLRKALSASGCCVVSLGEAKRDALTPDALLSVGADPTRTVQVVYWDRGGHYDLLSAPSPANAAQLQLVALALSSALIERHRDDTSAMARDVLARTRLFEDAQASRAIYAMLGGDRATPRTNVRLRLEEF